MVENKISVDDIGYLHIFFRNFITIFSDTLNNEISGFICINLMRESEIEYDLINIYHKKHTKLSPVKYFRSHVYFPLNLKYIDIKLLEAGSVITSKFCDL